MFCVVWIWAVTHTGRRTWPGQPDASPGSRQKTRHSGGRPGSLFQTTAPRGSLAAGAEGCSQGWTAKTTKLDTFIQNKVNPAALKSVWKDYSLKTKLNAAVANTPPNMSQKHERMHQGWSSPTSMTAHSAATPRNSAQWFKFKFTYTHKQLCKKTNVFIFHPHAWPETKITATWGEKHKKN